MACWNNKLLQCTAELNEFQCLDLQEAALSSRSWRGESISLCRMWKGICIEVWNVWSSSTTYRLRGIQMPILWQGVHGMVWYITAVRNVLTLLSVKTGELLCAWAYLWLQQVFSIICTALSKLPGHMIQREHRWCEQFQKYVLQILDSTWKLNVLEVKLEKCLGTPLEFNVCSACGFAYVGRTVCLS